MALFYIDERLVSLFLTSYFCDLLNKVGATIIIIPTLFKKKRRGYCNRLRPSVRYAISS